MDRNRRGAVLIVVTIVLLMVSLAVAGLLSMVRLDYQATKMRGREMMMESALQVAEGHVAAFAMESRERRFSGRNLAQSSELFASQSLFVDSEGGDQVFFSVVIPAGRSSTGSMTYGVVNESSRLNLVQLVEWDRQSPGAGELALMELPGMQPDQAASIMDWIDSDSDSRLQGGEFQQYQIEQRILKPANEVPLNIDTLANVRLTSLGDWMDEVRRPAVRFGNSGRQESNLQTPPGNFSNTGNSRNRADHVQHQPWEFFLTVNSGERNESFDGRPRIFLNDDNLLRLHEGLSQRVNRAVADFVVLYRQYGPGNGGRRKALADALVDFSIPARFQFMSELDLAGAVVTVPAGSTSGIRYDSPLGSRPLDWGGLLEHVMDQITVDPGKVIDGRINVDEAPREVLLAIPGMDPATADRILAARFRSADGNGAHIHATWLLEQGIVDLARMKELLKYCTTGGDVFQAEIVSFIPDSPWFLREIVVIDGTYKTPVKLYCKDRRDSGIPYELER